MGHKNVFPNGIATQVILGDLSLASFIVGRL